MITMNRENAMLLVIDIQERLLPSMDAAESDAFMDKVKILINGANTLGLPIIQSLQYVKGLGPSVAGLFDTSINKIDFEKTSFSCVYNDSPLLDFLNQNKHINQIIICGMETHVCVLQTARDLKAANFDVVLPFDAVISRDAKNKNNALNYMSTIGINVLNIESILFDLLKDSKASEFKLISKLIK